MAEKVRFRVWMLGGLPIVLVVAVVVAVIAITGKKTAPPRTLAEAREPEPAPAAVASDQPVLPVPTVVATVTASPRPSPPAMTLPTSASSGDPPEPIPELSELHRPPGSDRWTTEDKATYRRKVFDDLDARERILEREEAAARRSGDAETERRKAATLAYLREKRALVERMLRAQEEQQAPSAQGAEPDAEP